MKAYLNGTIDGILWPPSFKKYSLDLYGTPTQQKEVQYLRRSNLKVLKEMEANGVDVKAWLNASHLDIGATYTAGGSDVKPIKIIAEGFRESFDKFNEWWEAPGREQHRLSKKFRQAKANLGPFIKKTNNFGKVLNKQKDKLVQAQREFLEPLRIKLEENLSTGQPLPTEFLDLINALDNAIDYKEDGPDRKNYRIRFVDPRDIGHLLFMGNRANSCTSIGPSNNRILNLVTHIGTKYAVIEDPFKTLENPNGDAQGCSRFFMSLDTNGDSCLAQDTVDGSPAISYRSLIDDQIAKLGQRIGVKKLASFRGHGSDAPKVKAMIGGRPSYYDWTNSFRSAREGGDMILPETEAELIALDNWEPQGGWQELKS